MCNKGYSGYSFRHANSGKTVISGVFGDFDMNRD